MDARIRGDKNQVRVRFSRTALSARTLERAEALARAIAERYVRIVRYHIQDQDLAWAPLRESYREWKRRHGLDERIWIATGQLQNSLRVWKGRYASSFGGMRTGWFAGIPSTVRRKDTGVLMIDVMRSLEFGRPDIGMPPRPLFRPSARQVVEEARALLGSAGVVRTLRK
jgi:hypothetical protein